MRMVQQVLPPRVQNGEESDLRSQMFGIAGDGIERMRGGPEQNIVNHFPVVIRYPRNLFRQGEDHVKVFDRQQLRPARFHPPGPRRRLAFRTMTVTARVVADSRVRTLGAFFDVTAQRCRTTLYDGIDRALLFAEQTMALAIGGSITAKNIGQLESRLVQEALPLLRLTGLPAQLVQRT